MLFEMVQDKCSCILFYPNIFTRFHYLSTNKQLAASAEFGCQRNLFSMFCRTKVENTKKAELSLKYVRAPGRGVLMLMILLGYRR